MKKILIYGAGFFDVMKLVEAINRCRPTWTILGFLDDTPELKGRSIHGYSVIGGRDLIPEYANRKSVYVFNNVNGSRAGAQHVADLLKSHDCRIPNLIHPSIDLNYVQIGIGCIIPEGCVLGANVTMGNFVTMRYGSVISHEVNIGDFVLIGPGATVGSRVCLKKGSLIGAGATVILGNTVGEFGIVGGGAVVTTPVASGVTVAGVPAKEIG